MEAIIEAEHLSKRLGLKTAVDDLTIAVRRGEVFGVLGHNGAGKSTTIDCLLGLKRPDGGKCRILGMAPEQERKQLFEHVGVQLQHNAYPDKIKVHELCEETAVLYKNPGNYRQLLKQFGLEHCQNQFIPSLSGGERQKLSVLLALLPKPDVIFLDELTTGLDTSARREVWKQLETLKSKGVTILLTSHYMDEVEALCDRICLLKDGKEIITGTVENIIKESPYDTLEEAYLWFMGEEV